MLHDLAKLPRLSELQINAYDPGVDWNVPNLTALKSVEVLKLFASIDNILFGENFNRALPRIFPNLRKVTVFNSDEETRANYQMCFNRQHFARLEEVIFQYLFYDDELVGRHSDFNLRCTSCITTICRCNRYRAGSLKFPVIDLDADDVKEESVED